MDLPTIENVVSTAMLLPRGKGQYRLPLDALSRQLKCSQYAPVQFAANIIKISDSITDSTVLIFASGKIVVVASLTLEHTRYVSQLVRHIVEQVNCMVRDADSQVYESNLIGRTVFQECKIHNIVGSGNLNCRIDLQAMCDAAPLACKWFPDWFPGLKCKVWLTESHSCECAFGNVPAGGGDISKRGEASPAPTAAGGGGGGGAFSPPTPPPQGGGTGAGGTGVGDEEDILPLILGKQKKCTCAVKLLVFDSGRIVITGARSIENVNNVYFRIKRLIVNFTKNGPNTVERAKVKDELKTLLVKPLTPAPPAPAAPAAGTAAGAKEPRRKKVKVAPSAAPRPEGAGGGSGTPPLLKFALAGRINDIRTLLQMDKDLAAIKLTLQRLQDLSAAEKLPIHDEIINLLKIFLA